jgi:hypothetical protein
MMTLSISPMSHECSKKEHELSDMMDKWKIADSVEPDFWIPLNSLQPELNPLEYERKVEEKELSVVVERHFKNGRACKRSNTYSGKFKKASKERLRRNTVIGNEISPIMIDPSVFKEKKTESQETLINHDIPVVKKSKRNLVC